VYECKPLIGGFHLRAVLSGDSPRKDMYSVPPLVRLSVQPALWAGAYTRSRQSST